MRRTVLYVAAYFILLLPIPGSEDDTLFVQPFPEKVIEIGMIVAGAVGLLILIAPNFGLKPKPTVDGWRFPVKPTCLLLYYLALTGGIGAVAFGAAQLLASGTSSWIGWACLRFGIFPGETNLPSPLLSGLDRRNRCGGFRRSAAAGLRHLQLDWLGLLRLRLLP